MYFEPSEGRGSRIANTTPFLLTILCMTCWAEADAISWQLAWLNIPPHTL